MTERVLVDPAPQAGVSTPAQTSISTVAAIVLLKNPRRKGLMIQNTGTTVIKLSFGPTLPTQTVYACALKACTAADDGSGQSYVDDACCTEQVNAISSGSGGTFVLTEFTTGAADYGQAGALSSGTI